MSCRDAVQGRQCNTQCYNVLPFCMVLGACWFGPAHLNVEMSRVFALQDGRQSESVASSCVGGSGVFFTELERPMALQQGQEEGEEEDGRSIRCVGVGFGGGFLGLVSFYWPCRTGKKKMRRTGGALGTCRRSRKKSVGMGGALGACRRWLAAHMLNVFVQILNW